MSDVLTLPTRADAGSDLRRVSAAKSAKLRRRVIEDRDLPAVADMLARGFPERGLDYWRRGLDVMRTRRSPAGHSRYGLVLESDDGLAGVLLTIFSEIESDGETVVRCNLSSWHTEPEYRPFAALLLNAVLKNRDVTYINISPAPHTQPIIEAQGFRPFCRGSRLHLPQTVALRTDAVPLTGDLTASLPEKSLLDDHLALGCIGFLVAGEPFVFGPPRRIRRLLPSAQLLYCRSLEAFARHAGDLSWPLLKRGIIAVLVDTDGAIPGLRSRPVNQKQNRYVYGPHPPRFGDLAYTELAIFGG